MTVPPASTPPQPTGPNTPGTAAPVAKKKSGKGCFTGCLGCGCLSVIAMAVMALGFGIYVYTQGPALQESLTESMEVFASTGGSMDFSQSRSGGSQAPSLQDAIRQGRSDDGATGEVARRNQVSGLSHGDQFFDHLDRPMTVREIRQVDSAMKEWGSTRTVTRFKDNMANLEGLQDSDRVLDNIRALRNVVSVGFRMRDIAEEFPRFVERQGGDVFLQNYAQTTAIMRASQLGAGRHEAWEQVVADGLIADHDENQEAFQQARSKLQQAASQEALDLQALSPQEQAELQEAFANQFLLMTAAINRQSLQAWASLSDEERQAFFEEMNQPHHYVTRIVGFLQMEDAHNLIYLQMLGF